MLYLERCKERKVWCKKWGTYIFLGYSNKRCKAYKCLNLATHKVIESVHVKIDEFVERSEEWSSKEPREYKNFVYYEEEPETLPQIVETKQQQSECSKSQKEAPKSQTKAPKL